MSNRIYMPSYPTPPNGGGVQPGFRAGGFGGGGGGGSPEITLPYTFNINSTGLGDDVQLAGNVTGWENIAGKSPIYADTAWGSMIADKGSYYILGATTRVGRGPTGQPYNTMGIYTLPDSKVVPAGVPDIKFAMAWWAIDGWPQGALMRLENDDNTVKIQSYAYSYGLGASPAKVFVDIGAGAVYLLNSSGGVCPNNFDTRYWMWLQTEINWTAGTCTQTCYRVGAATNYWTHTTSSLPEGIGAGVPAGLNKVSIHSDENGRPPRFAGFWIGRSADTFPTDTIAATSEDYTP